MRNYDLVSSARDAAQEHRLVSPKWYQTDIDRKILKQLLLRDDAPAMRDIIIFYGLMAGFGLCAVMMMPSWLSLPFWLAYGVFYASGSDARWHEAGHGTAFKSVRMNRIVYQIASFMRMRNPVTWRWSHARHHTDTLLVGRDAEIALMLPPNAIKLLLNIIGLPDIIDSMKRAYGHILGRIQPDEAVYTPIHEHKKVFLVARIWLAIYSVTVAVALYYETVMPLLLIGGPRLYGSWHFVMTGYLQHGGLRDNVTDHRLNTRTVMMNPVSRFLYLNMNYHIEHHMFPLVPYYNLPKLHAEIKHDLPEPSRSIWAAYAELLPVLRRQFRGEEVFIERPTS